VDGARNAARFDPGLVRSAAAGVSGRGVSNTEAVEKNVEDMTLVKRPDRVSPSWQCVARARESQAATVNLSFTIRGWLTRIIEAINVRGNNPHPGSRDQAASRVAEVTTTGARYVPRANAGLKNLSYSKDVQISPTSRIAPTASFSM